MTPGIGLEYLVGNKFRIGPKVGVGFMPKLKSSFFIDHSEIDFPLGITFLYGKKHNIESFLGTSFIWYIDDNITNDNNPKLLTQIGYRYNFNNNYFRVKYGYVVGHKYGIPINLTLGFGFNIFHKKATILDNNTHSQME